jgi:hypothetical protein
MNDYVIYGLVFLIVFNVYVSIKLLVSPLFSRFQKVAQTFIIWVLPLLGGLFINYIIKESDRDPPPPKSTSNQNYGNDSIGAQDL